jgi:hypothetical protein
MPSIYNPSATTDVEIDDLGITIQPEQVFDITYIRRLTIINSVGLHENVSNGALVYVRSIDNGVVIPMSVIDGLEMIDNGVTGSQIGINKSIRPGIIEGNFYGVATDEPLIDDMTPANHLNAIPVNYLDRQFNRIGVCVTTAVANAVIRLGVYTNLNGFPGDLLLDAGEVPCDTAGNKEIVIDFNTPNDWCFLCTFTSDEIEMKSVTSQNSVFGNSSSDLTSVIRHIHTTLTYTSELPAVFPANAVTSSEYPPFVWFRKV